MRSRVAVVFGTRPEAIKLAPVIAKLRSRPDVECRVYVTAQHRQMLDQVLEAFSVRPDVDLNLMRASQSLNEFMSVALAGLDRVLETEAPHFVLVQGDTTTALAGALAAFHRHIPVGHVEAGLRSGNLNAPWPEEANRTLITRIATLHFAPTARNRELLLAEGVDASRVRVTGNTVVDALELVCGQLRNHPPDIPGLHLNGERLVLITGHRRESFGAGFEAICDAIGRLARRFPGTVFVYPVHLNPMVREPVNRLLGDLDNVRLIQPLPYLAFLFLMSQAVLVLTDSGGIQEEAPTLGKPVLVMRETTERTEAIEAGIARLVGVDCDQIEHEAVRLLTDPEELQRMECGRNPFGDGHASERIVDAVSAWLDGSANSKLALLA